MRRQLPILILLVLATASCGPVFGSKEEPVEAASEETVEAVVSFVLTTMTARYEEFGPTFTTALCDVKNKAAEREEFKDWADFKASMRARDPGLDVEVANRITAHMASLLAEDEEE